jgi:urate oxidase
LALGHHLLEAVPKAEAAKIRVEQYPWDRITVNGRGHDHAFVRRGDSVRTTEAVVTRSDEVVMSGVQDLVLLKSSGSEFRGFLKDRYTTLQETDDRILATSLAAHWRYESTDVAWNDAYDAIVAAVLETFADTYSRALQETLYRMGDAALGARPEVCEISFSAPNKHHFLVDLEPFGLRNDGEVFIAADRPYGLIEATVVRDSAGGE